MRFQLVFLTKIALLLDPIKGPSRLMHNLTRITIALSYVISSFKRVFTNLGMPIELKQAFLGL
jgi:hypothetical protein